MFPGYGGQVVILSKLLGLGLECVQISVKEDKNKTGPELLLSAFNLCIMYSFSM